MDPHLPALLTITLLITVTRVSPAQTGADDSQTSPLGSSDSGSSSVSETDNMRLVRRYVPQFVGKREHGGIGKISNMPDSIKDITEQDISDIGLSKAALASILEQFEKDDADTQVENDLEGYSSNDEPEENMGDLSEDISDEENADDTSQEAKRYTPSFVGKRSSAVYDKRQYQPSFIGKRYQPTFIGKRYQPTFVGKRYQPTFVGKRFQPTFVGKRYAPTFIGKRYQPTFVGKRYQPTFVGKRYQPTFIGKRYQPTFVGKRHQPDFMGKRYQPSFVGKRYQPSFVGKRYQPTFVGKRYQPSFVGKRYQPTFIGKRYQPTFVGKRYQPTFIGKRYQPRFVGKKSVESDTSDEAMLHVDDSMPVSLEKRSVEEPKETAAVEHHQVEVKKRSKRSLLDRLDGNDSKRAWGRYVPLKRFPAFKVVEMEEPIMEKRFVAPEFIGRRDSISSILSALKVLRYARTEPRLASKRFEAPLFVGKRSQDTDSDDLLGDNYYLSPLSKLKLERLPVLGEFP